MVRKNCYKYNMAEISIIVNEYLNTRSTFKELAEKYDRNVQWVMRLVHTHYDMDEKKTSDRYRRYKTKDLKVLVSDDHNHRIFENEQKVILWFQEFGNTPETARQIVKRALKTGKYMNLRLTYI